MNIHIIISHIMGNISLKFKDCSTIAICKLNPSDEVTESNMFGVWRLRGKLARELARIPVMSE